jgi:hypothetical protein
MTLILQKNSLLARTGKNRFVAVLSLDEAAAGLVSGVNAASEMALGYIHSATGSPLQPSSKRTGKPPHLG